MKKFFFRITFPFIAIAVMILAIFGFLPAVFLILIELFVRFIVFSVIQNFNVFDSYVFTYIIPIPTNILGFWGDQGDFSNVVYRLLNS